MQLVQQAIIAIYLSPVLGTQQLAFNERDNVP
jgi:hypothetical protein